MIPEDFVEDLEKAQRNASIKEKIYFGTGFLLGMAVLGTLLHETSHIYFLKLTGCHMRYKWAIGFPGIHASVKPLCYMGDLKLLLFYAIGYISTVIAGLGLSLTALREDFTLTGGLGTGILTSAVFIALREGDIRSIVNILELPNPVSTIISTVIFLAISLTVFLVSERLLTQKGSTEATGSE